MSRGVSGHAVDGLCQQTMAGPIDRDDASAITNETVVYYDIDMRLERDKNGVRYLRKTGEPHPPRKA